MPKLVFAELNWLPGVSPRKVALLVSQLKTSDKDLYSVEGIPDLARINISMSLTDTRMELRSHTNH
jgi:TctA family transporter